MTVDNHMTSIKYKPRAPTHITEAYGKIRYLNRIITKLNVKNFDNNLPSIQSTWNTIKFKIESTASTNCYNIQLPTSIDATNIMNVRQQIRAFHKVLKIRYDRLIKKQDDKNIKENKCTIIIDRVLQSNNGTSTLITDPNEIKKLTNQHFQQCAGGTQIPKEIPL
ncbi:hypothetical protein C1645_812864 [Glomus cerebriforme]|uniref:Uncharacterized protein n=1 Tax=Glomus cerebriforme TaxID=658196 RepID=A0A397TTA4_9GLOM|nr:hypothetical protein C1645_812864 [Glomus cerebriforme]